MDSEWHSFLQCSLTHSSRREFLLPTKLDCFFDKDCFVEILRCFLPGSGKTKSWSMLLRAVRAKSVIHVKVGFDSSSPKQLRSSLLICFRRVSAFSRFYVPLDGTVVSQFGWCSCMAVVITVSTVLFVRVFSQFLYFFLSAARFRFQYLLFLNCSNFSVFVIHERRGTSFSMAKTHGLLRQFC